MQENITDMQFFPWDMKHVGAHSWLVKVNGLTRFQGDDSRTPFNSELVLCEDGVPLAMPHALHDDIKNFGHGRYSHWSNGGSDLIFFSSSDNTSPRINLRRYTLQPPCVDGALWQDLKALKDRIVRTGIISEKEVLPFIQRSSVKERIFINRHLSFAALEAGNDARALDFAVRSWRLGGHVQGVFRFLVEALRKADSYDELWPVFYDAMLSAAENQDHDYAVHVFTQRHESILEAYRKGVPRPLYQDRVMSNGVKNAVRILKQEKKAASGRVKVGYILAGEEGTAFCSLPEIVIDLVNNQDHDHFEISVFSCQARRNVPNADTYIERLKRHGVDLVFLEDLGSTLERLRVIAGVVQARGIEVLVYSSQTNFHYLLAACRPAPAQIGLGLGAPDDYTSEHLDVALTYTMRPALDSLCDVRRIHPFGLLECRFQSPTPVSRSAIGLSDEDIVLLSFGRAVKFREPVYWQMVDRALSALPQARMVVIGVDKGDVPGFARYLKPSCFERVVFMEWRNDVVDILPVADVMIDTYPWSGGFTIFEAMILDIPVVVMNDDSLKPFKESEWTPTEQEIPQDMMVGAGDFDGFVKAVVGLVNDEGLRTYYKNQGRKLVQKFSDTRMSAEELERVFLDFVERG
ncbi:MAG: hypothetical protein HQ483_09030 [Rhodospirillales bacterium]|nr:hypothetical protein [Rhodospirillales bacterium]